ncbi:hypothetical protein ACHAWF_007121 [Thalassiosira exigua]
MKPSMIRRSPISKSRRQKSKSKRIVSREVLFLATALTLIIATVLFYSTKLPSAPVNGIPRSLLTAEKNSVRENSSRVSSERSRQVHGAGRHPSTPKEACDPRNFLVLIKGGARAKYQRRREIWRKSSCPGVYEKHELRYHFMLAMPAHAIIDPNGHDPTARASKDERSDMEKLRNESLVHQDMVFLSLKDVYEDFNLKTMRIFEWAVDRGMKDDTSMVILHDDEYCLRPEILQALCEEANQSNSSLYAGGGIFDHPIVESEKGFDGSFAPYFEGHLYALSGDLVRGIAYHLDTVFASTKVGFAEDLQVGKWVKNQADRKDDPKEIKYIQNSSLLSEVGVNCGDHRAENCEVCPHDHGASWCHGDCAWSSGHGGVGRVCQPRNQGLTKGTENRETVMNFFSFVNKHLVQQEEVVPHNSDWGLNLNKEHEKWYLIDDIVESDRIANDFHDLIYQPLHTMLLERHVSVKQACAEKDSNGGGNSVLDTGGWCLAPGKDDVIEYKDIQFYIPMHHVPASKRIVTELLSFIKKEGIKSVNDFGAGVGQYKHAILSERPEIVWNSYDGAGNVHEYTKGFVDFVDLTIPLELPKADWVVSLEVGEHVESKYEAMLVRNLHHHNRKGIILSWAKLGQVGHSHVNNHSNEYIISLFERLGYIEDLDLKAKLRNPQDNHWWFQDSAMAFRRLPFGDDRSHSNPGAAMPKAMSVNCGNHRADNCEACPQGHGRAWCNGECIWWGDANKCMRLEPDANGEKSHTTPP